jgi:excisionase family DNA binding protein
VAARRRRAGPEGRSAETGNDYRFTQAEMAARWEISEALLKQATALVEGGDAGSPPNPPILMAMTASTDPPTVLTTKQAARELGVSVETVRRLAREGHVPAWRLHGRGRWRYRLDDVERLATSPRRETLDGAEREAEEAAA